ncbi:hypothetical protein LOZ58_001519 [Ophidiomyces ophidiicola]|nr:hypothetical protein LOZ58_001519 [Ophidiomyces ophidiicola]
MLIISDSEEDTSENPEIKSNQNQIDIMSTPKPAINGQKLLNRIQHLEEATQALGQQNLELKDHNQQLEAQIMVTTTTTEWTSKAKVNPSEPFRVE